MMRLWIWIGVLMLPGCAASPVYKNYAGPSLPSEQVAYVRTESENDRKLWVGADRRVYIVKVDGEEVPTSSTAAAPWTTEAELTPGVHSLHVQYEFFGTAAAATVTAHFEAGKSYIVRREVVERDREVRFWIEPVAASLAQGAR